METSANRIKRHQQIYEKPIYEQFEVLYKNKKTGSSVSVHLLTNKNAEDYKDILNAAKAFARKDNDVKLLPEIYVSEQKARQKIFKGLNSKTSNPDLCIDTTYLDIKRPLTIENILKNAIRASNQGAEAVIIDKHFSINRDSIQKLADSIFIDKNYKQSAVHFMIKRTLYTINRTAK